MRHKLVNLCEESFQIASSHKNFSKWLRTTLLKDVQTVEKLFEYECESCNKMSIHPGHPIKGVRRLLLNGCGNCPDMFSEVVGRAE